MNTSHTKTSHAESKTSALIPTPGSGAVREGRLLTRETKRFATEQRGWSWWHLASTLGAYGAAIAVTCADLPWLVRLPASILAALVFVRLFVIYHDRQHGAIFEDSRLAGLFFRIYGLLTLAPTSVWQHTHDHHHRNNSKRTSGNSIGSYPVMTTERYRQASRRERLVYVVSRHPLTILFGYLTVFLFGFCILPLVSDPRRHRDAAAALAIHLGLGIWLAVIRPDVLLFAFLLPYFIASALGSYLFYAQHNFPGVKLRTGPEWDYVFAALRSSSFIRMGPVMSWFTGNIGYHHIHHLNAHIPFYRLPAAMAAFEELQTPGSTSLWPADIFRCLRLKLWDRDKDRFVSFVEARQAEA